MRQISALLLTLLLWVNPSHAVEIQELTTPSGIKIWLVESHSLPMISVQAAFRAGSAFDPENKHGVAAMSASLLDEGAGPYNAKRFKQEVEKIGAGIGSGADRLNLTASLTTLSQHKERAFELFGFALTEPHVETSDFTRMKDAILAGIKHAKQDPGSVSSKAYNQALYGDHPYGHSTTGTEESVTRLKRKDVKRFIKNNLTKANMVISIVGDITPDQANELVDSSLANLRDGRERNRIEEMPVKPLPIMQRMSMNVPQSSVRMGHRGINRHDPDYFAAYFMNYILGGGGFNSRLMEEIREKRGLAYGVYSYFEMLPQAGSFNVNVQTKNSDVDTSIGLIRKELHRMIENEVSDKEYTGAMSYLTGSFPLRLDSNIKILNYLTVMQMENLGIDYLDTWVDGVKKVTKKDLHRVAKRLLNPSELVTVIVGGE